MGNRLVSFGWMPPPPIVCRPPLLVYWYTVNWTCSAGCGSRLIAATPPDGAFEVNHTLLFAGSTAGHRAVTAMFAPVNTCAEVGAVFVIRVGSLTTVMGVRSSESGISTRSWPIVFPEYACTLRASSSHAAEVPPQLASRYALAVAKSICPSPGAVTWYQTVAGPRLPAGSPAWVVAPRVVP